MSGIFSLNAPPMASDVGAVRVSVGGSGSCASSGVYRNRESWCRLWQKDLIKN